MKQKNKIIDRQLLQDTQPPVSEAFKRQTLNKIYELKLQEEQEPMKRKGFVAVLITALMIFALAGVALGIAGHLGVIDFLSPAGPTSIPAEAVQTEFTQDNCTVDGISVRVRDAVSDGRTLFVAVEMSATTPGEAVLVSLDTFDHSNAEMMQMWKYARPDPIFHPDFEALAQATATHYVFPLEWIEVAGASIDQDINPVSGLNWRYEGIGTVVMNVMIDLQRLHDPSEALTITMHPTAAKEGTAEEYKAAYGTDIPEGADAPFVPFVPLEQGTLTTEVKAGHMDIQVAKAKGPFNYGDFRINSLEVATSPLATYITVERALTSEAMQRRNNAYILVDADGQPYEKLMLMQVFGRESNPNGGWMGAPLQTTYQRRGDLPETITLHAMEMDGRDESIPLPDDLVVELLPVN